MVTPAFDPHPGGWYPLANPSNPSVLTRDSRSWDRTAEYLDVALLIGPNRWRIYSPNDDGTMLSDGRPRIIGYTNNLLRDLNWSQIQQNGFMAQGFFVGDKTKKIAIKGQIKQNENLWAVYNDFNF